MILAPNWIRYVRSYLVYAELYICPMSKTLYTKKTYSSIRYFMMVHLQISWLMLSTNVYSSRLRIYKLNLFKVSFTNRQQKWWFGPWFLYMKIHKTLIYIMYSKNLDLANFDPNCAYWSAFLWGYFFNELDASTAWRFRLQVKARICLLYCFNASRFMRTGVKKISIITRVWWIE